MIRIYFDSNVFTNLKKNEVEKFQLLNSHIKKYDRSFSFFFSHAHIRDKLKDSTHYKFEDFDFIESITGDNYISYHALDKNSSFYLATPRMVFDDEDQTGGDFVGIKNLFEVNQNDDAQIVALKSTMNTVLEAPLPSFDLKIFKHLPAADQEAIKLLIPEKENFSMKEFMDKIIDFMYQMLNDKQTYKQLRSYLEKSVNAGKYISKDGSVDFNEGLKDSTFNKTFVDYVKSSISPNDKGQLYYYDFYIQSYCVLDMLGISKDNLTKRNTFSNLFNDALHSYYARYCDYFVSDDESTRQKTKALYNLYGVNTKVMNVDEFLSIVPAIGEPKEKNIIDFFARFAAGIKTLERKNTHRVENTIYSYLTPEEPYLNNFDEILEIQDGYKYFYWCTKKDIHPLSQLNFRETGKLIDKAVALFGTDAYGLENFEFGKEIADIDSGKWSGRTWRIGHVGIRISNDENTKKMGMWIGPVENNLG